MEKDYDNENVNFIQSDVDLDMVFGISEEFERDCRRYNRAFCDEQEVSTG